MIEIPDEPLEPRACSECMSPLTYIYIYHLKRVAAVIPLSGLDRFSFRLHTCALKPERTWRHVQKVDPRTTKRGAAKARAVLAERKLSRKPIDDKETTRP